MHVLNAAISALGNASSVANLLDEITAMSSKKFRRWTKGLEDQANCDMLTVKLVQTDNWDLVLHVFQKYVPRCNGYGVHMHNKLFASQLLHGELSDNLFVPVGHMHIGWPSNNSNESHDLHAWIRAAHLERHDLAYQTHGCDASPGPLQVGDGPRLHGLTHVGDEQLARLMVEHVACEQRLHGEHLVFPFSWMHRPRLAEGKKIAMTLVLFDKSFGNTYQRHVFGSGVPGSPDYKAKINHKRFRSLLKLIAGRLRKSGAAPLPSLMSAIIDGGITEIIDPVLGRTHDDGAEEKDGAQDNDIVEEDDAEL